MPELLAELRHFLVEAGDLLETQGVVSQVSLLPSWVHPPPPPPQLTKSFHNHSLLAATLRGKQGRGYLVYM